MVLTKQAIKRRQNLYMSYIDYRKAYDSVPHSWLIHVMQIYKIDEKLTSFLNTIMKHWRTSIHLRTNTTNIHTEEIPIKRGIFQGDSLSGLWFCLALNPLSKALNERKDGFEIDRC